MSKTKNSILAAAFALVLVGAGCSGTGTGSTTDTNSTGSNGGNTVATGGSGSCGPLKVTVDGQDVTGNYTNGLAYTMVNEGYRTEMVTMFTNKDYTCEDVLGLGRIDTNNLSQIQASYHAEAQLIYLNENNWFSPTTLGTKASAVGETQSICVNNAKVTGLAGEFEGKEITFNGALSGKYCGDKQG